WSLGVAIPTRSENPLAPSGTCSAPSWPLPAPLRSAGEAGHPRRRAAQRGSASSTPSGLPAQQPNKRLRENFAWKPPVGGVQAALVDLYVRPTSTPALESIAI